METITGICNVTFEKDTLSPMSSFGDIVSTFYFDPFARLFIVDYRKTVISAVDAYLHYDGDAQSVTEALSKPALYIVRDGLDGKIMISFDEVPEGIDPESIDQVFLFKKTGTEIPADAIFYHSIVISPDDIAMAVLHTGKQVQN